MIGTGCKTDVKTVSDQALAVGPGPADVGSRSPRPERIPEAVGYLADFHRSLSGSSRRHAARDLQASGLAVAQNV